MQSGNQSLSRAYPAPEAAMPEPADKILTIPELQERIFNLESKSDTLHERIYTLEDNIASLYKRLFG